MRQFILFSLIILLCSYIVPQTTTFSNTADGKILSLSIPITLAKSASYYSTEFDIEPYLKHDSTSSIMDVVWQSNDTVQATISLETKNTLVTSGTAGAWNVLACALIYTQLNAGNDTIYARKIVERGSIASGVTDMVSLAGKIGNKARIKVTFTNPTTVGNSGTFRLWAYLVKRTHNLQVN